MSDTVTREEFENLKKEVAELKKASHMEVKVKLKGNVTNGYSRDLIEEHVEQLESVIERARANGSIL